MTKASPMMVKRKGDSKKTAYMVLGIRKGQLFMPLTERMYGGGH